MAGHIPDSLSVDWCTPDWICEALRELFYGPPDLDPCSNPYSHVGAKKEFTLEAGNDGLVDPWDGDNVYVNPPFGRGWFTVVNGTRQYIWPNDRKAKQEEIQLAHMKQWDPRSGIKVDVYEKRAEKEYKEWLKAYKEVNIGTWIKRCADEGEIKNVVALIPAYPGTKAWQKNVWKRAQAVFFPEGRLYFRLVHKTPTGLVEKTGPAPMDCAMPLWTPDKRVVDRFGQVFSQHGHVELL